MSAGCHGECSTYNCPYPNNALVVLPIGASSPLMSVVASSPCSTNFSPGDFEGSLIVKVTGSSAVTCRVDGTLADGSRVQALVMFQTTPCCDSLTPVIAYGVFEIVDGGMNVD
jgi:hypothetical protein